MEMTKQIAKKAGMWLVYILGTLAALTLVGVILWYAA
jgi:hypothetical protein